ncbi:MAG TPA: amidohydrolase family protein [Amycolatopsis sp.]|uniref:amidohydrolase family protein n=1 Tax=Amycolatopsis sp. TaxID=37632 RepID=UPI002B4671CA|nr:amidohydrolase family protein [Amycolatopsis sp.]HKS47033.1 amidohydrolase family protein [Amycolatopsis sp.]
MTAYLLRDVEVGGRLVDVRVESAIVAEVGTGLTDRGAELVEGRGHALIPGLVDHHVHLLALAAELRSVNCGPPEILDAGALRAALAGAELDDHGWVRGTGYVETIAGPLHRWAIDELISSPVRIQHRSGAMWMLNSAAAAAVGLNEATLPGIERDDRGRATGRVWRADSWLRGKLLGTGPPPLEPVSRALTAYGITAVADATPDLDESTVSLLTGIPQDVLLLGTPSGPAPCKIVLADSALPGLDELAGRIRSTHDAGRPVAVHCVTREALFLLLAAFTEVGSSPGDRIEHASVVPDEALPALRRLGVRVVTQPGFLADRGDDYLRDVDPADLPGLYRVASFRTHAIPVALSSDAPYGPLNPWEVITAAATRRTRAGAVVNADEALDPRTALEAYLSPVDDPGGPPRRVAPGASADLALLDGPLDDVLARSGQHSPVRAVFQRGLRVPAGRAVRR